MRCINILQEAEEISKGTKQSRIYLELAVIKMCKIKYDTSVETILARINKLEERIDSGKITVTKASKELSSISTSGMKNVKSLNSKSDSKERKDTNKPQIDYNENSKLNVEDVRRAFKDIQSILKQKNNMVLATALMMGRVSEFNKGVITISFDREYNFHKNRLEKDEFRKLVNDVFSEILGEKVSVIYEIENDITVDDINKEKLISDMFPSDIIEVYEE